MNVINNERIGNYLKNKRENLGYGYDDIFDKIRIKKEVIIDFEKGKSNIFENEMYDQLFLKKYIVLLGISEEEISKFVDENEKNTKKVKPQKEAPAKKEKHKSSKKLEAFLKNEDEENKDNDSLNKIHWEKYMPYMVVVVMIIFISFVIMKIFLAEKEEPEYKANVYIEEKKPIDTIIDSTKTVNAKADSITSKVIEEKKIAFDDIELELDFHSDCYIAVKIDTSAVRQAIIKEEKSLTWTAKDSIILSLGNLDAVSAKINGTDVSFPSQKGILKKFKIDHDFLRKIQDANE